MNPADQSLSSPPVINSTNVDLTNCDREQIQYSGAVQPHGVLLVLDRARETILQASANIAEWFGVRQEEIAGMPLSRLLTPDQADIFRNRASRENIGERVVHLGIGAVGFRFFHVLAHQVDDVEIWELETAPGGPAIPVNDLYNEVNSRIDQLNSTPSLQAFFDLAVEQIRAYTGYERVMAYKFAADGSGHVIAESVAEGLEKYLGLHYPASDIPIPARRLFSITWLRHLPNVDYHPIPIMPERLSPSGNPLDLSRSYLRSVSVMYTRYLQNMGVKSTMVITLLKNGKLWGLMSCMHHSAPKQVPYEIRISCEFLAHMVSLLMGGKEELETRAHVDRQRALLIPFMEDVNRYGNYTEALARLASAGALGLFDSRGTAIVGGSYATNSGRIPSEEQLGALVEWLNARKEQEPVLATHRLSDLYPPAADFANVASGLLALRLVPHGHYILFFRPEHPHEVNWAGDPNHPVSVEEANGELRLAPRGSFALWRQETRLTAEPWLPGEVEVAGDLRRALVEIILKNAHALAEANKQLEETNAELASFAYAASHDLKEPLRGIHNYSALLERSLDTKLTDTERARLRSILSLTTRMEELLESLLVYSRAGQEELYPDKVLLEDVLQEALEIVEPRRAEASAQIRSLIPPGKMVSADRVRLIEILQNLLVNAIKYNDKAEKLVEVGCLEGKTDRLFVRDNGIGIASKDAEMIFRIFKRLHARDQFGGGSGAGLTITRRLIERHGGKIWIESEPGVGTTFWFTLKGENG